MRYEMDISIEEIKYIRDSAYKQFELTLKNKKKFEMRCYERAFIDTVINRLLEDDYNFNVTPEMVLYFMQVYLEVQLKYFSNNKKRYEMILQLINVIEDLENRLFR